MPEKIELCKNQIAEIEIAEISCTFFARDADLDVILAADVVWLMDLVEPLADAIATVAGCAVLLDGQKQLGLLMMDQYI